MSEVRTAHWPVELATLRVRERPGSISILRIHRHDSVSADALGRAFAVSWPVEPNSTATRDGYSVLWMAPGQWAITDCSAAFVTERAAAACGSTLYLVSDVSDGFAGFVVEGVRSRELLAKGCSLDLHPTVFKPGACAQTLLAQVTVLLHRPQAVAAAEQSFRLYVDASVGWYLRRWLRDAAFEFTIEPGMSPIAYRR